MTKQTNSKKAKKINQLEQLLQQHQDQFTTLENGKIKCILTTHEFLPSEENLIAHLTSKSYKKASEAQFDITEYKNVLSTHKDNEQFLFCRLTGAKVPKKKTAIEKHVNGKKFKARFQEYKAQLEAEKDEDDEDFEGGEDVEEEEEAVGVEQAEKEEQQQEEESEDEKPKKKGKQNGKNGKQIKKGKKRQDKKLRNK